ncbi:MAG: 50S ribosomal protein L4 [Solirubrobacterales bacterium]|nr:50S ribosomal protein L4 [Solirubrobacterales bacterium]
MAETKTPKVGKVPILGKTTKADLPADLFTEDFHQSLVHETARADANARRRGTASTLTRGEVSMTTAKAWRQKGTGRARVGALSVGSRYGGAATFGPKPRHYTVKVNRKARRKAMRSALSVHSERGSVAVVKASDFEIPSTKAASEALTKWGAKRSTLLVILGEETGLLRSFRNIPRIDVMEVGAIGVVDVIGAASIVISEGALEVLEKRAGTDTQGAGPTDTTTEKDGE